MRFLKKAGRILLFTLMIVLASFGLGVMSSLNNRERFMDKENQIELVQKKEDEDDSEQMK
jgi:hypothetical protein